MESFYNNALIILPILLAGLFFAASWLIDTSESGKVPTVVFYFGSIAIKIPFIKQIWLARCVLWVASLVSFCFPLFIDYSSFFPNNYMLNLSYKDKDVEQLLENHGPDFLKKYNIPDDWLVEKHRIWEDMLNDLSDKFNEHITIEDIDHGTIVGPGYISFEKTGFMRYTLLNSWAYLDHTIHKAYQRKLYIYTRCKLEAPAVQQIKISDLLKNNGTFFIECVYFQYLYTPNALIQYFEILAVTDIQLFPLNIGHTIYLWEDKNSKKRIPIGEAENIPLK